MIKIILKSLRDLFDPIVLGFILKVGLGSFFGWILILYLSWDSFSSLVEYLIGLIPYIGKFDFIKSGSAFLIALLVGYMLIIITISTLTSLYGPKVVAKLAQKEYGVKAEDKSSIIKSIYYTIKATIIFIILFILLLPFIFIPIVGQVVMLFLWAILIKEPTLYDITSLFNKDFNRYKSSKALWIISLVAATFNYIPILNIFAPLFAYIMFMHYILTTDN